MTRSIRLAKTVAGDRLPGDDAASYVFGRPAAMAAAAQGPIDLTKLPAAQGFVIRGGAPYDNAGRSVSSAGDVNGDGFDDMIVGAPFADDSGFNAGAAYVIFGKADGFGTIDLHSLAPVDGFVIQGDAASDLAGWDVSSAGDVNDDGFADVIVGALRNGAGGNRSGAAYVIFGKSGGFGPIDLGALAAADGFVIQGDSERDSTGASVAAAGDVNGDGFDDVIVGAYGDAANGAYTGAAYVIFGKAGGFGMIDLSALAPADGFAILGDMERDFAGRSVSSAGDVNGDGFADLIIGAYGDDAYTGAAYVIFGKAGGFGTIDLAGLAPADGFVILGDAAGDRAGNDAASAGDINGDGFDDVIVGAVNNDDGGFLAGAAYVIFGKAGGFAPVDLAALAPATGFVILGGAAYDYAGFSVSSAGDVNGDGFDDVIVGANLNDAGGTNAGAAYVIFGKAGGFGTIDLTDLAPADGFVVRGAAAYDNAGRSVSGAGDVNGDGFADLMIGAPFTEIGGTATGSAYVIFGAAPTVSVTRIGSAIGQTIRGGIGDDTLDGRDGDDTLSGADGDDALIGGAGRDTLAGGGDDDDLAGGSGNDLLDGGDGDDDLRAGSGRDMLAGGDGSDRLTGGSGEDRLDGGLGSDVMAGESGDDTYVVNSVGDRVIEEDDAGTDTVESAVTFSLAARFVENLTLTGGDAINATGNEAANVLTGNGAANVIRGAAGNDILSGRGGDDTIEGGAGGDTLDPGEGIDTLSYASSEAGVTVNITRSAASAGGGDATGDVLAAGFDNIVGSAFDDVLTGNGGANVIQGNDGIDRIVAFRGDDTIGGGAGDDVIRGDGGADRLTGGAGNDIFYFFAPTDGGDTITDFSNVTGNNDIVRFKGSAFGGLAAGALAADRFVANTSGLATTADQRFVYETDTGQLWYDADGTGTAARVLLAELSGAPLVTIADFTVV